MESYRHLPQLRLVLLAALLHSGGELSSLGLLRFIRGLDPLIPKSQDEDTRNFLVRSTFRGFFPWASFSRIRPPGGRLVSRIRLISSQKDAEQAVFERIKSGDVSASRLLSVFQQDPFALFPGRSVHLKGDAPEEEVFEDE